MTLIKKLAAVSLAIFSCWPALAEDTAVAVQVVSAYQCMQCHSLDGRIAGPGIPRIAGQKQKYLLRQMRNFKLKQVVYEGELVASRLHPVMNDIAARLSYKQMAAVAGYYSSQECAARPSANVPPKPEGAERCESCHGGQRSNPWRDTPFLNAQDETYLLKALRNLWSSRNGETAGRNRHHRLAEIMFTDNDAGRLQEYAAYFAGLPCRTR